MKIGMNAACLKCHFNKNLETAYGCGYNIYYAFLVKCQMFADRFQNR